MRYALFSLASRGNPRGIFVIAVCLLGIAGCGGNGAKDEGAEAPPTAQVEHVNTGGAIQVEHPEQFPTVAVTSQNFRSSLVVTGVVNPDVSRTVPVVTLVSGRVVDVRAKLGDTVEKGQLLLRIRSTDVSGGYADYRKAVADELLTRKQLDRAKDLYAHGAMAQADLEASQDAEDDAKTTLDTAEEHLRLLGNDPDHPAGIVDISAPVSGVITDQEVTEGSSIQSYSANPFTISDLTNVWVVCDVYENDLSQVRMGDIADIQLNAFPEKTFQGKVSNIGTILDPNLRTAKVRIELRNPGLMRIGMFVQATFHGQKQEMHIVVPATAILHLHDHDWVFVAAGGKNFQLVQVTSGDTLPGNMQEITSGIKPGAQVVRNALVLQNTVEQ